MSRKLFRKKQGGAGAVSVQTGSYNHHPFSPLTGYTPLADANAPVYRALREAVPLIDAAISKLARLTLDFSVDTGCETLNDALNKTLQSIPVGGCQRGIHAFMSAYFEQLLTYGSALGEIVYAAGRPAALYNAELESVDVRLQPQGMQLEFFNTAGAKSVPVRYPERILFSVLNPEPGKLRGTSLLRGLPFVSEILMKIYSTIGTNWERAGNLRYAVTYNPPAGEADPTLARDYAQQIAEEWKSAMQSKSVKDFVAVGDVSIRVIGADNQILDCEVPVRQMLEQIVAKTGLAPFMFGLSWSTTERMSAEQADILTSELRSYRAVLTPVICKIANALLLAEGHAPQASVVWNDITLRDETELARADLYRAQAEKLRKETADGQAD